MERWSLNSRGVFRPGQIYLLKTSWNGLKRFEVSFAQRSSRSLGYRRPTKSDEVLRKHVLDDVSFTREDRTERHTQAMLILQRRACVVTWLPIWVWQAPCQGQLRLSHPAGLGPEPRQNSSRYAQRTPRQIQYPTRPPAHHRSTDPIWKW